MYSAVKNLIGAKERSESVVWSDWDASIKYEIDLSSFTPFFGDDLFGFLALTLRQDMEGWIHLLILILIMMKTKLVVMGCHVLPALLWLDV